MNMFMKSAAPYLPLLTVIAIAAVTLYVSRLRRPLKAFEITLLILLLSIPLLMLGVYHLGTYGWGVFVMMPFLTGFVSALLYCRNSPGRTWRECRNIALGTTLAAGVGVLAAGLEGLLCLAMASPLVVLLSLMGAATAFWTQERFWRRRASPALLLLLLLSAPLLMGAEAAVPRQAPVYEVRTLVEIDAPPEAVWRNVVSFRQLPPPDDWVFHTGIAYPVRAEIRGRGLSAVRYCEFSTGPFVEPIEVWDEPRRLAFRVTANPPDLQELSPWGGIHPPHVQGFLVSRRGQFRLTGLPGGRTRLEGTTWYQHGLYPAGYWRLWSDWIIHRIHLRVLEHVKRLSEEGTGRVAL
jgi:hypothetical protein